MQRGARQQVQTTTCFGGRAVLARNFRGATCTEVRGPTRTWLIYENSRVFAREGSCVLLQKLDPAPETGFGREAPSRRQFARHLARIDAEQDPKWDPVRFPIGEDFRQTRAGFCTPYSLISSLD